MGVPQYLIILMRELYDAQTAKVRTAHGDTNTFNILKVFARVAFYLLDYTMHMQNGLYARYFKIFTDAFCAMQMIQPSSQITLKT